MSELPLSKPCTQCRRDLPLSHYHKHPRSKYGLRPRCKDCIHEERTAYYERTRTRSQEYSKSYYQSNADKVLDYQKQYATKNREKVRVYQKQWRTANSEKLKTDKAADFQKNKAKRIAQSKAYSKAHPEIGRAATIRKRARLKQAGGSCTPQQWRDKFAYHGGRCYLCQTPLTLKTAEIEHRKPISRGGSNWPANLAPACTPCNSLKRDLTEAEYRRKLLQTN